VKKGSVLDASDVAEAKADKELVSGNDCVRVTLTEQGKERFAKLTEGSVGKRLAIVVDGKILSAPVIQERIAVGAMVLTGGLSAKEASELAEKFNGKK
jgi:preprotein translocase subunit SecD